MFNQEEDNVTDTEKRKINTGWGGIMQKINDISGKQKKLNNLKK